MIIRHDIIKRANDMLKPWKAASEFTKTYRLLHWAETVGGVTIEEICIVLYPDEIHSTGAPRARVVRRVRNLVKKVRHHPMNDGMVPFAIQKKLSAHLQGKGATLVSVWLLKNITDKTEWAKICDRMEKTITGFKVTMRKFSKIMEKPLTERQENINRLMEELAKELKAEEIGDGLPIPTNKKKKRKMHPLYQSSEAET